MKNDISGKRIRVNAKQTAKGYWQLDVTVETTVENIVEDTEIPGMELQIKHPDVINEIIYQEKLFRDNNRKMVEDK